MFEGIPCWPKLPNLFKPLKEHGVNVTAVVYAPAFGFVYNNMDEVKAGVGRGLVLQVVAHPQPGAGGAVGVGAGLLKPIKPYRQMQMPQPDFVLCCNNICNCMTKWYENIARMCNVPLIMIDIPYNNTVECLSSRPQPGPSPAARRPRRPEHGPGR